MRKRFPKLSKPCLGVLAVWGTEVLRLNCSLTLPPLPSKRQPLGANDGQALEPSTAGCCRETGQGLEQLLTPPARANKMSVCGQHWVICYAPLLPVTLLMRDN